MKTIKLDTGVEQFKLPGGVLRFNPADPNVYVRFQQALESLQQLEQDMAAEVTNGADFLQVLARTDKAIKQNLNLVFGPGNDFDAICGGVNLLSADAEGQRLISKLFAALEPVLLEGARQCAGVRD